MQIYKDKALIDSIGNTFDLGTLEAGNSKEYTYYIYNETAAEVVDIDIEIKNSEVEIISAPKKLKAKETANLILKWSPSVSLKQGLKEVINIRASEIYS